MNERRLYLSLLHYVVRGNWQRACRVRDWMKRRGYGPRVIGLDN